MTKLRLKQKRGRKYVWLLYEKWCVDTMDMKPKDMSGFSRILGRECRLSDTLLLLYKVFECNEDRLIEYCNFIYKSWSELKGNKAITDLQGWFNSDRMLSRFANRVEINQRKTFSNHNYMDKASGDHEFTASFICAGRR